MIKALLLAGVLLLGPAGVAQAPPPPAALPAGLPTGDRWLRHFQADILPFWDLPDAWGTPRGSFPTFRANDGRSVDWTRPPAELAEAPGWIQAESGRQYVRMISRQTYVYCVAFHLTGDARMLALARDGVDFLRSRALDPATGSAVTYWEHGVAAPAVRARTSQDLAYAGLGLAMYYYLTRDRAVLADLERLRRHIFAEYWQPEWQALRWVVTPTPDGDERRQELVAQLDQVNAYLLLVAPLLPPTGRAVWLADLGRLARTLTKDYFNPEGQYFWGTLDDPARKRFGARHVDFGHTAKAFWMLERLGRLTGDRSLVDLATRGGRHLLAQAYLPDSGTWGSRWRRDGSPDPGKEWWIYAELDQLAETLALHDPAAAAPLPRTTAFWFDRLVDPVHHEVWGGAGGPDDAPWEGPKIHQWKSGYHSAEHALVGYLTAQALHGRPAVLYFALPEAGAPLRPYLFAGHAGRRLTFPLPGFPGRRKVAVAFTNLG